MRASLILSVLVLVAESKCLLVVLSLPGLLVLGPASLLLFLELVELDLLDLAGVDGLNQHLLVLELVALAGKVEPVVPAEVRNALPHPYWCLSIFLAALYLRSRRRSTRWRLIQSTLPGILESRVPLRLPSPVCLPAGNQSKPGCSLTSPLGLQVDSGAVARVDHLGLLHDQAALDELADAVSWGRLSGLRRALTGVGQRDLVGLVGVEPDPVLAALENRRSQSLLQPKLNHFCDESMTNDCSSN